MDAVERLREILRTDDAEAVLLLVPLALVAWADGDVDMKEIWNIASHHAKKGCVDKVLCLSEDGRRFFYDFLVYRKPTPELIETALDLLEAHLDRLPPEKAGVMRRLIVEMCTDVARSSGGIFGLHKVSGREDRVIAAVRDHLRAKMTSEEGA